MSKKEKKVKKSDLDEVLISNLEVNEAEEVDTVDPNNPKTPKKKF